MMNLTDLPPIGSSALAPGEVHVWYCRYDPAPDPRLAARYEALMTDEERARCARFHFERDRHLFRVTRALVRTTLSRYGTCEPTAWRFGANEYGRPHISGPVDGPHFNLSNTHGLVACAVAPHERIGVDVENTTRKTEPLQIADRFFSRDEVAALKALPATRHRERFFALWTLKEAYIKARGMGLAIPLGEFSYSLDDGAIRIRFGDKIEDTPQTWHFALTQASEQHVLAVATGAGHLRLLAAHTVPLME
jgi:4'-phosphopantetheinyl transferase